MRQITPQITPQPGSQPAMIGSSQATKRLQPAAYRERLSPRPASAAALSIFPVSIGIAYGYVNPVLGALVFGVLIGLIAVLSWIRCPVIEITDTEFRTGTAHIPWEAVSDIHPLTAEQANTLRGRDADPRAFLQLRMMHADTAVKLDLCDPRDPHPYWLVTTSQPRQLAKAARQMRQAAATGMIGCRQA